MLVGELDLAGFIRPEGGGDFAVGFQLVDCVGP